MAMSVRGRTIVPMKMELTEGSETSAYINQTPGNYPKRSLLYSVHGESLKSRIQNNMLIDILIEGADIVRYIKAQRIEWLGHIQRMDQARPAMKLIDWKPMGIRPVGRLRQ